ncbi:PID-CTERM protein-sorting domain-containing protein [Hymenobacter sp. UYCo722]|uniref:PID-CTERM protein-sorting domain-containing protein n=1 Tax=Hymenobacter sp. UYCo722 TaxID=3156335 RepID=UPI00339389B9
MKKTFLIRSLFATVAAVLFTAAAALAQGPGSGGPTPTGAPTQIPIDGGASLLLAAGGAYGLKRLRAYRAAKKQS